MKLVLALFVVAVVVPSGSQTPKLPIPQLSRKVKLFRHHSTIAWVCGSSSADPFVYEVGLAVDADGAFKAITRTIGWGSIAMNMQVIRATGGPWLLTRATQAVGQSCKAKGIPRRDITSR